MFSDYECPYCKRGEDVVAQVMSTYGDKIRLVFRDYPLPFHANARPAAEAAKCANAQGKFWEYHDKLFANQASLGVEDLKRYAGEVGLDQAQFDSCVGERKFQNDVQADLDAGQQVGVDGTPAFFINGRMLSGAQPFEAFKSVIDEELAAKAG
jgi:protein-disulfide isomerase